jgi:aspartyl-tRNA synthetase
MMQLSELEKTSFGHLLDALKHGAPPHGGIALGNQFPFPVSAASHRNIFDLGFDRLMSILCKAESIREVIAFPKTSVGTDLLFKSPAAVDRNILYQYGIGPRT